MCNRPPDKQRLIKMNQGLRASSTWITSCASMLHTHPIAASPLEEIMETLPFPKGGILSPHSALWLLLICVVAPHIPALVPTASQLFLKQLFHLSFHPVILSPALGSSPGYRGGSVICSFAEWEACLFSFLFSLWKKVRGTSRSFTGLILPSNAGRGKQLSFQPVLYSHTDISRAAEVFDSSDLSSSYILNFIFIINVPALTSCISVKQCYL